MYMGLPAKHFNRGCQDLAFDSINYNSLIEQISDKICEWKNLGAAPPTLNPNEIRLRSWLVSLVSLIWCLIVRMSRRLKMSRPGGGVGPGGETLDIKDPHAEGVETEVGHQDAQDIHHESSFGLRVSVQNIVTNTHIMLQINNSLSTVKMTIYILAYFRVQGWAHRNRIKTIIRVKKKILRE